MSGPTASSSSGSSSSSRSEYSTRSDGLPEDLDTPFQRVPTDPAAFDAYKHLFPHYLPMETANLAKHAEVLTQLHLANEKLKADAAKAKEDAAKPKPESVTLQLLKLAPAALQVTAMAIPFFGAITIESIKLAGMFLATGAALGVAHQASDASVRVMRTVTKEAGVGLKIIAFLGAGAAIVKGGHAAITEGPKTVKSMVDTIRARVFSKPQQIKDFHEQLMARYLRGQHPPPARLHPATNRHSEE